MEYDMHHYANTTIPSNIDLLTVGSMYSHQSLPSFDRGIWQTNQSKQVVNTCIAVLQRVWKLVISRGPPLVACQPLDREALTWLVIPATQK